MMSGFHTIVVAVDFSENSCDALRRAVEIAREANGALHLVHVAAMPVYTAWAVTAPDLEASGVHARYVEDARLQLTELASTLAIEPFRVTCAALPGQPAAEIVAYAARSGADLLVVGAHGHGAVSRLLLGSVAEQVVQRAPCPVLVVPPAAATSTVAA
jgi:nucleotide-binding universal stress UspA family protein